MIGQAAEFDYSGTQACKSLREEGVSVILVNNNPATIMTDRETADAVYLEPLTVESVEKIIAIEKPDGLLPTLGGQTGLNLAVQLGDAGVLDRHHVRLLGTPLDSIRDAEDRELFRNLMQRIGEPTPESAIVHTVEEAEVFAEATGFPLVIRPAYTLGGTGGGVARSLEDLQQVVAHGLAASLIHQVLVERYLEAWGEIEYEVMRDAGDTCITVCNMENLDPMGVHTGDSIVIAPSQTLTDRSYQRLRSASLNIIRALRIEGGCNVQFALSPDQSSYFVIEVNPRVSRSSALASKATGYPIARVAAKIALGLRLHEIRNQVTQKTFASFEPALDYAVIKIPRFPFDKFTRADRTLGTQMKATGEVMALGRSYEEALLKAVRSLETGATGLLSKAASSLSNPELEERIRVPSDERLFALAEAVRRGLPLERLQELSGIAPFFLEGIRRVVDMEKTLQEGSLHHTILVRAKRLGFSDAEIASLAHRSLEDVRKARQQHEVYPVFKMVDTCASEFEAVTPYYYSTYETEDESVVSPRPKVIVIGSGPIRIGQGIEFDYSCVHAVKALKQRGYEAIIVNNNPETVSTDFDISDKLYFEPLTVEDVFHVIRHENPEGVIVQFGGQTALNIAEPLQRLGAKILGTRVADIDMAEDREKMDRLLHRLKIPRPAGRTVVSALAAFKAAEEITYPVLVRPSYVLGGRAMELLYSPDEMQQFIGEAVRATADKPLLVDKYLPGKELEVDLISDGEDILIPGIMEHIERAGVHSGDSMAVYPPISLPPTIIEKVVDYCARLARGLHTVGVLNIQFVAHENELYVLEANPRASRTIPFLSKATGIPMVPIAIRVILGEKLRDLGYPLGLVPDGRIVAVKAPVFSFSKLTGVDIQLGPEMKSTGELMGIGATYSEALLKAFIGMGMGAISPDKGACLLTISDREKEEAIPVARKLHTLGFKIYSTHGTADFLRSHDIPATEVRKIHEGAPNLLTLIQGGRVALIINSVSPNREMEKDGLKIRRASVEASIPCLTSLDTANALLDGLALLKEGAVQLNPVLANTISSLERVA